MIYNTLEYERLTRKYTEIRETFDGAGLQNWGQTLYIHLMRTLGDKKNSAAFVELAKRVPLNILMRERSSPMNVEALLVGASGLLNSYNNDSYVATIRRESSFLLHKYHITPLVREYWNLVQMRPINHPIFRLSQVATMICNREFILNDIVSCVTHKDVDDLFGVDATSHLLSTHSLNPEQVRKISIGALKRSLIGINLVVPAKLAYGYYTCNEDLCAEAFDLNERLPAETNVYTKCWSDKGLVAHNAYESQAHIQLSKEYCLRQRCKECVVARYMQRGG